MKRIIYKKGSGICVVIPSGEALSFATIDQIAKKDVPEGVPYKIVDTSSLPTDRENRNDWTWDDKNIPDGIGADYATFTDAIAMKAAAKIAMNRTP